MEYNKADIKRLTEKVEKMVGKKIEHPRDFDFLRLQVEGYTGDQLSVSTLKRLWGYVPTGSGPSPHTLDVLARMTGYTGWNMFVRSADGDEASFRLVRRKLFTTSLKYGDMVRLVWSPNRMVTVRYEGQDLFTVVETANSKLCAGDTFHCMQFIDGEPLFLSSLYRPGIPACDYICGRNGGIQWRTLT